MTPTTLKFLGLTVGGLGLLALGAIGVTRAQHARIEPPRISDWRNYSSVGHILGSPRASVRIVEFADFQCEFCRVADSQLRSLRMFFHDSVAIVYRHLPVRVAHKWAVPAALASECAGQQGRFEAFHDALYASQTGLGTVPWEEYANRSGVSDLPRFRQCMKDREGERSILDDEAAAQRLHIPGAPTLLVNGWIFVGMPRQSVLRQYTHRALEEVVTAGGTDWSSTLPSNVASAYRRNGRQ
jgi:hypothetical protein